MRDLNALTIAHHYLAKNLKAGSICIDATAGRGKDTVFLAQLVGETGKVIAFDIQQEAIDSTKKLLEEKSLLDRTQLVLDSHSNMGNYANAETIDAISFNLGWLPGGDHSVFTKPKTSIEAIEAGLKLLKVGGIMTICIYYGRDCGYTEKDSLLEYLPTLDYNRFNVLVTDFINRPNDPPIPVLIHKEKP